MFSLSLGDTISLLPYSPASKQAVPLNNARWSSESIPAHGRGVEFDVL